MKKRNQSGFTLIETLLVIIAITLIGFAGWYVWNANQDKDTNTSKQDSANTSQKDTKTPSSPDPTKDWKSYNDSAGGYSLRYPTTWVSATSPELCSPNLLLLGSSAELVGRCASDSIGQISISYDPADVGKPVDLVTLGYENVSTKTVTVAGVSANRQSGVITQEPEGIGPAAGSKAVQYRFTKGDKIYLARYTQDLGTPDITADFDSIMTKTFTVK